MSYVTEANQYSPGHLYADSVGGSGEWVDESGNGNDAAMVSGANIQTSGGPGDGLTHYLQLGGDPDEATVTHAAELSYSPTASFFTFIQAPTDFTGSDGFGAAFAKGTSEYRMVTAFGELQVNPGGGDSSRFTIPYNEWVAVCWTVDNGTTTVYTRDQGDSTFQQRLQYSASLSTNNNDFSFGNRDAAYMQADLAGYFSTSSVLTVTNMDDLWDAATTAPGTTLTAEQGSYTLTGQTANLLRNLLIAAEQGSYTITGQQANLLRNLLIQAEQGSYSISGQQANLLRDLLIAANQGSYTLTGQDAALFKTFILTAETGTYNTSGSSVTLLENEVLEAVQGSYTLTGQDADLGKAFILTADQGSYTLSGQTATLLVDRLLSAQQGNYTLNGQDADLLLAILLDAQQGSYTLSGQDATLFKATTGDATQLAITVKELYQVDTISGKQYTIELEVNNLYNIILTAQEKIG